LCAEELSERKRSIARRSYLTHLSQCVKSGPRPSRLHRRRAATDTASTFDACNSVTSCSVPLFMAKLPDAQVAHTIRVSRFIAPGSENYPMQIFVVRVYFFAAGGLRFGLVKPCLLHHIRSATAST
jgi:hypothetical protein